MLLRRTFAVLSFLSAASLGTELALAKDFSTSEIRRTPVDASLVEVRVGTDLKRIHANLDGLPSNQVTFESFDASLILNNMLPNRGKKLVAISKPMFTESLSEFCKETSLLYTGDHVRAGSGIECILNSAHAAVFMSFDGELSYWLTSGSDGSIADLKTTFTAIEQANIGFKLTLIDVSEKNLPPIVH